MEEWDDATIAAVEHVKWLKANNVCIHEFMVDVMGEELGKYINWDDVTFYIAYRWQGLKH